MTKAAPVLRRGTTGRQDIDGFPDVDRNMLTSCRASSTTSYMMHPAIDWVARIAESGSDDGESCTSATVNDETQRHGHEVEESNVGLTPRVCDRPHERASC
jgi:hypothetical protein